MGAEFLFMDDNARPHHANIVDKCLQSEDITRMDWPAYSPDLNPIEHVWDMLGRRIAARQPPPTCLPELRRALLDEWCNIPQDQIDNLILSMPRHCDRGSLVVKETHSWPLCHEFVVQRARLPLNMSRLKRPPVDMVQKLGEEDSRSGVVLVTYPCLKITRFVAISPRI
ncbi:transposable element Tcb1 transposase [Trichonephila clavipes]|nr:transposable element Tcb1 transposase [Trichonephila clavipes]